RAVQPTGKRGADSSTSPAKCPGVIQMRQALGNSLFGQHLQAKLRVSQPHDHYEQEADRIADQITRMPHDRPGKSLMISNVDMPTIVHRACDKCEEEDEEHKKIQRKVEDESLELTWQGKRVAPSPAESASSPPEQLHQLSSGVQP